MANSESSETVALVISRPQAERLYVLRHKLNRLVFAYKRCECGALYAHLPGDRAWDCSDILLGLAVPMEQPGSVRHGDTMPFAFWKVKEAPHDWAVENRIKREESSDAVQG